jgi:hypothetical protein
LRFRRADFRASTARASEHLIAPSGNLCSSNLCAAISGDSASSTGAKHFSELPACPSVPPHQISSILRARGAAAVEVRVCCVHSLDCARSHLGVCDSKRSHCGLSYGAERRGSLLKGIAHTSDSESVIRRNVRLQQHAQLLYRAAMRELSRDFSPTFFTSARG